MKLYRYRPLNALLFKELMYQELYFSSGNELNDPLDLTTRINFHTQDYYKIRSLSIFLSRYGIPLVEGSCTKLSEEIKLHFEKGDVNFVDISELKKIVRTYCLDINEEVDVDRFFEYIEREISSFINFSSVVSFTESPCDFLMWSHYSTAHAGICIEYDTELISETKANISFSDLPTHLSKVKYYKSLPSLSFYDVITLIDRLPPDNDCDWYSYDLRMLERKLRNMYTSKLEPWKYESEWRLVDVSFEYNTSEERIRNCNIKSISGIYFGVNTDMSLINRIKKIFEIKGHTPNYYQAIACGNRGVYFDVLT